MRLLSVTIAASLFTATAWAVEKVPAAKQAPAAGESAEFWQGVVLVVVGAVIGYGAGLIKDYYRRITEEKDVAGALYQEIVDRAARCCLDFKAPWQGHLTDPTPLAGTMDLKRVLKFRPADPIVYPDIGIKMALLKPGIASPVIHFFFRLDAWRRDIDHWRELGKEGDLSPYLSPEECQLLAKRLGETLSPALEALEALQGKVSAYAEFDRKAMSAYFKVEGDLRATLREMADVAKSGP